ncbi:alpha/beta fold hydrolase [Pseudomonas sp. MIACH]|uniref:alpha/beta fold hydrolase n=1 Tax=Pseudomonas sp. MIACH TaxID=1078355 RepID=UPI00069FDDD4|nr:alpha/beta fold hydrolase [Pseudomonas sp. MIACH]
MNVAKYLAGGCFWLLAHLGQAQPLIKPTTIDWLLDCPLPAGERLDPEVLARTQCGVVTVPRNHAVPREGEQRLYLTRVGAREPLSREGIVFVQAGDAAQENTENTLAIDLASRWNSYSTQAYRTLLNRYDVIELSARDLTQEEGVEQAVRDMEYVRAQLGDAQLHYLGNTHATRLGNRYAALFPERVARMVLVNAQPGTTDTVEVAQLRLKEPASPDAGGCINRWVGDFLAYGKQPPPSTRCLDSGD